MPDIVLTNGAGASATLSTTGASILELSLDSKKLIHKAKDATKVFAGAVLAPWQNRLAKGEWVDSSGRTLRNPINEIGLGNAHHGLVFDADFSVKEQNGNLIAFQRLISESVGYPFKVNLEISYELTEFELVCRFTATNVGAEVAPFVIGFHPYFAIGDSSKALLTLPARSYYTQTKSKIPEVKVPTQGSAFDFSNGKVLAGLEIDDFFTDLSVNSGEIVSKLVTSEWSAELHQSENLRHLVVYLTDHFDSESGVISALALEPASGAANAFNNQQDLVLMKPGENFSGYWGVRLATK
jgi:aldose 1-epimerase